MKLAQPPIIVGWRELVCLPELGLVDIPAKIDTGARTSSLHAIVQDDFVRDGERFVRFAVDWDGVRHQCEAVHVDVRGITSSNGDKQERLNERVERFQQRLVAQYTAMDANLSRLNALSSYVTQQLAALTASQKD